MAKLIYLAIASADGYIDDPDGRIDWGMPDEELLGFINELEQPVRTYLYGRRMYEAMLYWETAHTTVQVLPPVSLSDGADLGDPGREHPRPAQAGVTCPRDWRAAAGWETATGPAPGHAQPGRSDRRLTPASRKGPGSA